MKANARAALLPLLLLALASSRPLDASAADGRAPNGYQALAEPLESEPLSIEALRRQARSESRYVDLGRFAELRGRAAAAN